MKKISASQLHTLMKGLLSEFGVEVDTPHTPSEAYPKHQTEPQSAPSLSLRDALRKFYAERYNHWAPATQKDARLVFRWLLEHFGESTPLASIKKPEAASFREGLLRLERNSTATKFKLRQTEDQDKRIGRRTASKYLDFAQSFFNWAAGEAGLIEYSPFCKLTIKFAKTKSGAARAATTEEAKAFLETPLFQGHQPYKLHLKGPVVARDDYYWAMLLQVFSGTRIGEIAQLRVQDVKLNVPVPYMHLRKVDDQGNPIDGNTLKTANADRKIPICTILIKLGFLEFVAKKKGKKAYLFPALAPSPGQKSSSKASKFAQRYLERVGQKSKGKATHWLRHGKARELRGVLTPDYQITHILGQAQSAMHTHYGSMENLAATKKALDSIKFGFNPLAILLISQERWQR